VALAPRQHGGGQERERRSGTQDVAGAVGLATALGLARAERASSAARVQVLRDRLCAGLLRAVEGARRTVPPDVATLPGHLHICIPGVEREEVLVALGREEVCASGGSSCASGALEPSHVLAAMGVAPGLAAGALRFTLGYGTTEADVDRAIDVVPGVVAALRRAA
jgi:cysteine desulfurase